MRIYDLIVIGAGPAGISAGIYAKNFGLDCLIIGEKSGGLVNGAYKVENYPGIFNVTGKELTKRFLGHLKHLKIILKKERVEKIFKGKIFRIKTPKNEYQTKSIILAFGTEAKKLNIKNIDKLEGKGVSYRTDDSAFLYKNKIVAVVGGANAAAMSACMIAEKAKKVYLIYRKEKLRADAIWINKLKKIKNIEVIYNTNIVGVEGKGRLEKIILDRPCTFSGKVQGKTVKVKGLLIEVGWVPDTYLIHDLGVETDDKGYIKVNKKQATNISGIFAAGDTTAGSNEFRQIITAAAEGALAVLGVFNFLNKK